MTTAPMTSTARTAYHECLDQVERHQVTTSATDQAAFITALRDQLTLKLASLLQLDTQEGAQGIEFSDE